ncbi:MAG TPA: hypothetical protein VJX67_25560 [Blastocatellia bacterium]|nr:hypothetical protein [Blastocatellia bacterium]
MEFLDLFFPRVREYAQEGALEFLDKEIFSDITAEPGGRLGSVACPTLVVRVKMFTPRD